MEQMQGFPESQPSSSIMDSLRAARDARMFAGTSNTENIEILMEQPLETPWAILSYTWRNVFRMSQNSTSKTSLCTACKAAAYIDIPIIQIDTCFISGPGVSLRAKSTMSGLEYADYRRAPMCLVYLQDVVYTDGDSNFMEKIQNSSWLNEACALQELLASNEITFYSSEAKRLCKKSDILQYLSLWTRIDVDILQDPARMGSACIAKRMSWAAGRQGRSETDVIHSLKGIFNITALPDRPTPESMFHQLQFRLMQMYPDDLSIFAWRAQVPINSVTCERLLADSPAEFAFCHRIDLITPCSRLLRPPLYSKPFKLDVPLYDRRQDGYLLGLECFDAAKPQAKLGICVRLEGQSPYYHRANAMQIEEYDGTLQKQSITVLQDGRVGNSEKLVELTRQRQQQRADARARRELEFMVTGTSREENSEGGKRKREYKKGPE